MHTEDYKALDMMCCLVNNLGRVRLANLDKLDFEIRISDFAIKQEIRKQTSSSKNPTVKTVLVNSGLLIMCADSPKKWKERKPNTDFAFYCKSEMKSGF